MSLAASPGRQMTTTASVPVRSGTEVSGFHSDVEAQLRELGYLDE